MAVGRSQTVVFNNFVTSTWENRRDEIVDNIYVSAEFLIRLRAKNNIVQQGGRTIQEPYIHEKFGGGSFGRGSTFDTTVTDFMTSMEFNWKWMYAPVNLHIIDLSLNSGPYEALNLADTAVKNGRLTITDRLSTMLFADGTGNGGLDWDGLANGVSRTGDYGNITRAATGIGAAIRAGAEDSDGGLLSLSKINANMGSATIAQERPDLIVTTQSQRDYIWDRSQPSERNQPGGSRQIGFTSDLRINQADVIVDNHVPSGVLYILNTDYIKNYVHDVWDFRMRGPMEPTNQMLSISQIVTAGNFIVCSPRLQAVMTGLTES